MSVTWVQQLRALHDESFSVEHDWAARLRSLNESLGLEGRRELATPTPRLPPSWFVGDIEALQPGGWVLSIGLNQKRSPDDEAWHEAQGYSPQAYWDYWRLLNRNSWYAHYYAPRVRIASAALGLAVPRERAEQQKFATTNMVFVEICPYSSLDFRFKDADLLRLSAEDDGFRTAARIRRLLIEEAQPAFVLISGNQAITVLEQSDREHLRLGEPVFYPSAHSPGKSLWHREGYFTGGNSAVPVIACPALRNQGTHNANAEVDQIGSRARALVRESSE